MQIDVFLDSVESALTDHNWHAALAVALILPDICAKLEAPSSTSRDRYVSWFNAYLKPKYVAEVRGQPEEFLSGEDLYALRCAYLHEGADDITGQDAQRALDSFRFVAPCRQERQSDGEPRSAQETVRRKRTTPSGPL